MINEILDEIRLAEAEADEMQKKAAEDAKNAVIEADEQSRIIRADAIKAVKEERRKVVESATNDGNANYQKILASGRAEAGKLVKETDVGEAVKFIKEKVLASYVDR